MDLLPAILLDCFLIFLCALPLVFLLRFVPRRGRQWAPAIVAGALAVAALTSLFTVRPVLRAEYIAGRADPGAQLEAEHGFYTPQRDATGTRFVWTRESASFLLHSLVYKPITITFEMRSAATSGGPDAPVRVEVNGADVGTLRPDPANPNFQPLALRVTPRNWGGQETEIKLIAAPFQPGQNDRRVLGTMIRQVSVDQHEAWSGITRRRWLIGMLPLCAAFAATAAWFGRRRQSALARYAALAACLVGAGCAFVIALLVARIGVIGAAVYQVWIIAPCYLACCFLAASLLVPVGQPEPRSVARLLLAWGERWPLARWALVQAGTVRHQLGEDSQAGAKRRAILRDLAIIFIIAMGFRLVWAVLLPPWQAIDETEHFAYANHIIEQRTIPHVPLDTRYDEYSNEERSSLSNTLFYPLVDEPALRGLPARPLPVAYDYPAARDYRASGEDRFDSGGARAITYPPLYYLYIALPAALFHDASIVSRLFAMRVATVPIGALSCCFAYLLAYELRRTRLWGWSFGLCIALMPAYAHLTASINNDAAVDAAAIVITWLMVRTYQQRALTRPLALALGIVSGLALLSKPTILPLLIVAGIVALVGVFPLHRAPRRIAHEQLGIVALYAAAAILVYAPWLLFRLYYYGDLGAGTGSLFHLFGGVHRLLAPAHVSAMASLPGPRATPQPVFDFAYSFGAYLRSLQTAGGPYFDAVFFRGFWGIFGWGGAELPAAAYTPIKVFYVVGAIGLIAQFVAQPARRRVLLLLFGIIVFQIVFVFVGVDYFISFAHTGKSLGVQGRYFMPMLAPMLFLLLSGWDHLCGNHPIALRLAPVGMLLLEAAALANVLTLHYGVTG